MKKFFLVTTIFFIIVILLLGNNNNNTPTDKLKILVTILPQLEQIQKIGGDKIEVMALIPPGYNPATYELTPEQTQQIVESDIYFRIGHVNFEKTNLDKIKNINPNLTIIDTSKNTTLREIEDHDGHEEDNHAENKNNIDPHVWLSPLIVKQQALIISQTLSDHNQINANFYKENNIKYQKELDDLHIDLEKIFSSIKNKTILVYHPAFGYLTDEYKFEQKHIEIEGKEPSLSQIKNTINFAKSNNIKVIFVQEQMNTKTAEVIATEINGTVIKINPLSKNYLDNMKSMANSIKNNLE